MSRCHISQDALCVGCERAQNLFLLSRLREQDAAAASFAAVYRALGFDTEMREALQAALNEMIPVRGVPEIEATASVSMVAGVLVGLLIADSALPAEELDLPVVPTA